MLTHMLGRVRDDYVVCRPDVSTYSGTVGSPAHQGVNSLLVIICNSKEDLCLNDSPSTPSCTSSFLLFGFFHCMSVLQVGTMQRWVIWRTCAHHNFRWVNLISSQTGYGEVKWLSIYKFCWPDLVASLNFCVQRYCDVSQYQWAQWLDDRPVQWLVN